MNDASCDNDVTWISLELVVKSYEFLNKTIKTWALTTAIPSQLRIHVGLFLENFVHCAAHGEHTKKQGQVTVYKQMMGTFSDCWQTEMHQQMI